MYIIGFSGPQGPSGPRGYVGEKGASIVVSINCRYILYINLKL